MYISQYTLRNFRSFRAERFSFQPGVNTIIGENGSGKSNALWGLRLLLDEGLSRRAAFLRESDFTRTLGEWRGHWIILSLRFEDVDSSEDCQMIRHLGGDVGAGSDGSSGTLTYYFRPKEATRAALYEMTAKAVPLAERRTALQAISIDDYEYVFTGRAGADFCDESVYKAIVGKVSTCEFPDPSNVDLSLFGSRFPGLHREVSCTFVKALRDVVAEMRGIRDNPLLALLQGAASDIEESDRDRLTRHVASLNLEIAELSAIKSVANGVEETLGRTVGAAYAPSVSIESSLPEELDRLLQRLSLKIGDQLDDGFRGDLSDLGLGGANLLFITLKLLEYDLKTRADRAAQFLLVEEPEAHLHTHLQRTLFKNVSERRTQVMVTTHSVHLSSAARIESVNILARRANHAEVFQPSNGLDARACARIERYLDAVRSTLLFAKAAILVEGAAEQILIPVLAKSVLGVSLDELGVSLISMDAAVFDNVASLFHADRIRRRCAIVTDSDAPVLRLPEDPSTDSKAQQRARASWLADEPRRRKLDKLTAGNPWLNYFAAPHTFEVDLLQAGNRTCVDAAVDTMYERVACADAAKAKLASDEPGVAEAEVLRLATKAGKGWFALLVAEHVTAESVVPCYILDALAFVGALSGPSDALSTILRHRARAGGPAYAGVASWLEECASPALADLVEKLREANPKDPGVYLYDRVIRSIE